LITDVIPLPIFLAYDCFLTNAFYDAILKASFRSATLYWSSATTVNYRLWAVKNSNESIRRPVYGSLTIPIITIIILSNINIILLCLSGKVPFDKLNDSVGLSWSRFLKIWITPLVVSKTKKTLSIIRKLIQYWLER